MYPNLKAEMARNNITIKDIAEHLGKSEAWVQNRLSKPYVLPTHEAIKIKQKFFKDVSFEYLFSEKAIVPQEVIL